MLTGGADLSQEQGLTTGARPNDHNFLLLIDLNRAEMKLDQGPLLESADIPSWSAQMRKPVELMYDLLHCKEHVNL